MPMGRVLFRYVCLVIVFFATALLADNAQGQPGAEDAGEPPTFLAWLEVRGSRYLVSCNANEGDQPAGPVYQLSDRSAKGDPPGRGSKLAMSSFQEWLFVPVKLEGTWFYQIESRGDGRVLEFPAEEIAHPGTIVRVGQRKDGARNQLWRLEKKERKEDSSFYFVVRSAVNQTLVLNVHAPAINQEFTNLSLWHYLGDPGQAGPSTHQEFELKLGATKPTDPSNVKVPPSFVCGIEVRASRAYVTCNPSNLNKATGDVYQCTDLSPYAAQQTAGSKVVTESIQQWLFVPVELDGTWAYRIESRADGRVLEFPEEETPHPGTIVRVGQRKDGARSQLWRLENCNNTPFYVIRAAINPTLALDVHRPAIDRNFTGLHLWHYYGGPGHSALSTHQEFLFRSQASAVEAPK